MGKKFFGEFKEFISRGNVIDLAVGLIIGSAFTAIVTSLVNDVVMPLIGAIFGGIDFTSLRWVIREASEGVEEASLNYGNFIQSIVNFLLIALVIFCVVKSINTLREKMAKKQEEEEKEEEKEEEPSEEVLLLREIRDSLKK